MFICKPLSVGYEKEVEFKTEEMADGYLHYFGLNPCEDEDLVQFVRKKIYPNEKCKVYSQNTNPNAPYLVAVLERIC